MVETQEKEGMLTHDASSSVGMALTCGFIFMLLVDQIGGAHGGHSHSHGPGMFLFFFFTEYFRGFLVYFLIYLDFEIIIFHLDPSACY